MCFVFFFKQKTAYEMRISDWSSDVCSSDLEAARIADWAPPGLPIGGGALVRRGVKAGPDVARLLRQIERQWIDEGFPAAGRVEQLADQAAEGWLRATR